MAQSDLTRNSATGRVDLEGCVGTMSALALKMRRRAPWLECRVPQRASYDRAMANEFTALVRNLSWLALIALAIGATVVIASLRSGADGRATMSRLAAAWLAVAVIGVCYLTLTPVGEAASRPGSNLNLFAEIDARNVVANLGLFVPIGFLSRLAWDGRPRPMALAIILCVALSLTVEGTQLVAGLGRSADVQDLALNSVGGTAGAVVGTALLRAIAGSRFGQPVN